MIARNKILHILNTWLSVSHFEKIIKQNLITLIIIFIFPMLSCSVQSTPEKASSNNKNISSLNSKNSFKIPFDPKTWYSLQYSSIPSNIVNITSDQISIQVHHSASPLIYPMTTNPLFIKGITVKGQIDRLIHISSPENQGEKNLDDFNLRMGLVLLGEKRLNWFERSISPEWIKTMFDLAPKDRGIDHIYFLNAVLSSSLLNKKRTHPISEYIKEHYVWLMKKTGSFSYSHRFQNPKHTGALWISADGDDTQSTFHLQIQEISLDL